MALRKGARSSGAPRSTSTPRRRRSSARAPGNGACALPRATSLPNTWCSPPATTPARLGKLLGLNVPAIPVEHQYIVYDESPELKAYRQGGGRELAVLRESDQSYYLREERMGWILGPYEKGAPARFAGRRARLVRAQPLPGRPRPAGAARRGGHAPRAGAGELRHQGHRQRPDLLHPGWQSPHRPGVRRPQRVA